MQSFSPSLDNTFYSVCHKQTEMSYFLPFLSLLFILRGDGYQASEYYKEST